jgi:hypothetical protein
MTREGQFAISAAKPGTFAVGCGWKAMKNTTRQNTDRRASKGMLSFIVVLFVVALAIAGLYFFVFTPEKPQGQPAPHAINQSQ